MNTGMVLNHHKKLKKENWDLNKNGSNIYKIDKGNNNLKKYKNVTLNHNYDGNKM